MLLLYGTEPFWLIELHLLANYMIIWVDQESFGSFLALAAPYKIEIIIEKAFHMAILINFEH